MTRTGPGTRGSSGRRGTSGTRSPDTRTWQCRDPCRGCDQAREPPDKLGCVYANELPLTDEMNKRHISITETTIAQAGNANNNNVGLDNQTD